MKASKQVGSTDHSEVWLQAMKPSYTTSRLTSEVDLLIAHHLEGHGLEFGQRVPIGSRLEVAQALGETHSQGQHDIQQRMLWALGPWESALNLDAS